MRVGHKKTHASPPLGKRSWTLQEEAYLEENWGKYSLPTLAKNLSRTVNSIKCRAARLQLGPCLMGGEYITLNQLVIAVTGSMGNSGYKVKSWVKERGLPVHTKRVDKNSFRVVYLDEFWEWAKQNRSFLDFSKFEPLILGEEPEWVAEQRKKDYTAFSLQRKDRWTPVEDQRLVHLLKQQKYGYKELSKILHRSAGAIQRRCTDLGIKYRPVKADNHSKDSAWTADDYQVLADGIKNGDSYTMIGDALGKSEKAVRGKVYFVYLTENADKVRAYIGDGDFGDGAPEPLVRQALHLSRTRTAVKNDLGRLADALLYRALEMKKGDYDHYFQRAMCARWDNRNSRCEAGCTDCDSCTEFQRIRPQYCRRCGVTFYERESNDICNDCRRARKKQAQRKWAKLNAKNK